MIAESAKNAFSAKNLKKNCVHFLLALFLGGIKIIMPVKGCSSNGKPGYKWGDAGKCYTYNPNSEASKKNAKKRALAQGIASGDINLEAFAFTEPLKNNE